MYHLLTFAIRSLSLDTNMVAVVTSDDELLIVDNDVALKCGLIADFVSGDGEHHIQPHIVSISLGRF